MRTRSSPPGCLAWWRRSCRPAPASAAGLLEDFAASPFPTFKTFIPRRIGAEDAALDGAVVGEPGADPALSDSYRQLTAEITKRVDDIAAQEGRHRAS